MTVTVAVPAAWEVKVTVPKTLGDENPPVAPPVFMSDPDELSTES